MIDVMMRDAFEADFAALDRSLKGNEDGPLLALLMTAARTETTRWYQSQPVVIRLRAYRPVRSQLHDFWPYNFSTWIEEDGVLVVSSRRLVDGKNHSASVVDGEVFLQWIEYQSYLHGAYFNGVGSAERARRWFEERWSPDKRRYPSI